MISGGHGQPEPQRSETPFAADSSLDQLPKQPIAGKMR